MMKMRGGMFTIVLVLVVACNFKQKESKPFSMNQPKRDIHQIKKEVRLGNIDSYNELQIVYMDYPVEEFLFWAMLMANKYDYPKAHLDVFYCTINSYGIGIDELNQMDTLTQKFALEHLNIAANKGVKDAKGILSDIEIR